MTEIDTPDLPESLSTQQMLVISSLMTGAKPEQAAVAAGVSRNTVYRWMREPKFQAVLHEKEHAVLDASVRKMLDLFTAAIDRVAVLVDGGASEQVQLNAATQLMNQLYKFRELRNVEERISELEAFVDNLKGAK